MMEEDYYDWLDRTEQERDNELATEEYIEQLETALMIACKYLKKAGVVYGKENGKPVRLSTNNWYEKLMEKAKAEMAGELK